MNIQELRREVKPTSNLIKSIRRHPIVFVLDNINDGFNIGAAFRLADAVAAEMVYLCGSTIIPPHKSITRASINTDNWIEWEYAQSTPELLSQLKQQKYTIVGLENTEQSYDYNNVMEYKGPVALIIGNEVYGIQHPVLEVCDFTVKIPMYGFNNSLNCTTALSIIAYDVIRKLTHARGLDKRTQGMLA